MPSPTDETKVDIKVPSTIRTETQRIAACELGPVDDDDEDLEEATIPLTRLPWPEPPRNLGDRSYVKRPDIVALSRSIASPSRVARWQSAGLGAILIASLSLLLTHPTRRPPSAPAAVPPAPARTMAPAMPAAPAVTPAPAMPAATAPAAANKPSIEISNLPVAPATRPAPPPAPPARPRRIAKPAPRPSSDGAASLNSFDANPYDAPMSSTSARGSRSAQPASTARTTTNKPSPSTNGVDDGF